MLDNEAFRLTLDPANHGTQGACELRTISKLSPVRGAGSSVMPTSNQTPAAHGSTTDNELIDSLFQTDCQRLGFY